MSNAPPLLDLPALDRASVRHEPFSFLVAEHLLPASAQADLTRDFPDYREAGFFPYEPAQCGPAIVNLVEQLSSPAFAATVGTLLGIEDLATRPSLVTLCRHLNRRHGTIHTDSRSKIATALLYFNADWPDTSDGCLRFLGRIDDIDDTVAPEVRPLYGTFAAFRRADNSFHGHLPHQGERRVIQIAWLVDENEKERKRRRGRFSHAIKKLLGRLDRRVGAGRDDNAAHRD